MKKEVQRYVPRFDIEILNIRDKKTWDATKFCLELQAFFATIDVGVDVRDLETLARLFRERFRPLFIKGGYDKERQELSIELFGYILKNADRKKVELDAIKEALGAAISEKQGEKIMTIAESLIQEGLAKGRQEGLAKGHQRGIAVGLERGLENGKLEDARRMLEMNYPLKDIVKITGLSRKKILAK